MNLHVPSLLHDSRLLYAPRFQHGYGIFKWPDGREPGAHSRAKGSSLIQSNNQRSRAEAEQRYDGQWRTGKQHGIGWRRTERIFEAVLCIFLAKPAHCVSLRSSAPKQEKRNGEWMDGKRIRWGGKLFRFVGIAVY